MAITGIQFGCSADTDQVNYQLIRLKDNYYWQGSYFVSTPVFMAMASSGDCEWISQIPINKYNAGRFPAGEYLLKFYKGSDKTICSYQEFTL